jgi:hypothetical protein
MTDYRIVAIPEATADAVRSTPASPQYGHPAHVEEARGYAGSDPAMAASFPGRHSSSMRRSRSGSPERGREASGAAPNGPL